jgi:hypothetical protein
MFLDTAHHNGVHTRKFRVNVMDYLELAPPTIIAKRFPGHASFALEYYARRLGLAEDLLQKRPKLASGWKASLGAGIVSTVSNTLIENPDLIFNMLDECLISRAATNPLRPTSNPCASDEHSSRPSGRCHTVWRRSKNSSER